jgi:hypothetical protein
MATREVDVDDEVSPSLLPTVNVAAVFASVISRLYRCHHGWAAYML